MIVNILSKHAVLLSFWILFHALRNGRIDLNIRYLHQIYKSLFVLRLIHYNIIGVVKYATIWKRIYDPMFYPLCDIVCPKESSQSTSRTSTYDNLRGFGEQTNFMLQTLQLFDCYVVASEIKLSIFVFNWMLSSSLMS